MITQRVPGETCYPPFPMYEDLVERLLAAHRTEMADRDPTVAHVLATCAGYAYADIETMAMMATRLGLEKHACVRIAQTVDAMFVSSTAYLLQSRCGRVVILCYRGTEPMNLSAWIGDADVGLDWMPFGNERLRVHSGFYRNIRVSRREVLHELRRALEGRSLLAPETKVEHALEALYVTGHSLGGAMAVLLALSVASSPEHRAVAETLRATYTFGQPLVTAEPLPPMARDMVSKFFRHTREYDPIPRLAARAWESLSHLGPEYRYVDGEWGRSVSDLPPIRRMRDISRLILPSIRTHGAPGYALAEHGPHQYISALRPPGRVTEFGDQG